MPVRFSRFLATAAIDVWSLFPSLVMRMCWLTSFLIFTMYKALFYCQHVIPWPANKTDRTTATINSLQPFSFIHIYTYVRHGECVWRWNFFHDLLPILFVQNSFLAFVHSLFIQTHILTIYISPPPQLPCLFACFRSSHIITTLRVHGYDLFCVKYHFGFIFLLKRKTFRP